MRSCYSILECYNLFSGVKFSVRSFFLFASHLNFVTFYAVVHKLELSDLTENVSR